MPVPPLAAEALLVLLRWLHVIATIAMLGWAAVYWLDPPLAAGTAQSSRRFKEVVEITLLMFLATGAVLSFDRLSRGAGDLYAGILVVKIALAVATYQYAFRWRRAGLPSFSPDGRLVILFGGATVLLASVLKGVFESGLRGEL